MSMQRARLRAIDQGTRYDISGNLRRLERGIRAGLYGQVKNVVVIVGSRDGEITESQTFHFGNASVADAMWLLESAKKTVIG